MIYILDKKEHFSSNYIGHFGLQFRWMQTILSNKESTNVSYSITNFKIFILLIFFQKGKKIFFPNMSLYDRNSIMFTIIALITPFSKKVIICHTISKIHLLNWIFFRLVCNSEIYTYSNSLKNYIQDILPKKASSASILAEYPNARMMKNITNTNLDSFSEGLFLSTSLNFISWGSPLNKIDKEKVIFLLENYIDNLILVGKYNVLKEIKNLYPKKVKLIPKADDKELAFLLSNSDFNLITYVDEHNFYEKKYAASGNYLTSLMFGIPSIIWCNFGIHREEILNDGASVILKNKKDALNNAMVFNKKAIPEDKLTRIKISLEYLS